MCVYPVVTLAGAPLRRIFASLLLLAALLLPASASTQELADTGEVSAARATVPVPPAFLDAIEAGTRTTTGEPGPSYWQQWTDYRIEATLDPASGRIEGREWVTVRNRSPDTLSSLVLRLEQNVFAPGARRNRRAPVTGGIELRDVRVAGEDADWEHPGSGYYEALTLARVELPAPLPPGEETEIEISWSFTVPPAPTFRTGNLDGDVFAVAQWYPRLAVYDDVYGWDMTPYLGDGEFYLEYGSFDVRITVPAGWLVGATGLLMNTDEVLGEEPLARLARVDAADETVRIVEPEWRGAGRATAGTEGESLTWHFEAENVRDFAFSTSPSYVWDARRVTGLEGNRLVVAHALYRPTFQAWREAARYAAHTVRSLSEKLVPYPYPQVTVTEGPVGGMEYPMMVFNPGTENVRGLAGVTVHEVAHQWFPMLVGSMEAKHAWMDEGFVSYWDELVVAELFEEEPPRWGMNQGYLRVAGTEAEVPIMRHTDLVSPYGARGLAAYTKPAVVLGALRSVVGDDVFRAAFRDYTRRWAFRHPQPWDFFNTVERHAGRDLDWFWGPLLFETAVLDRGIEYVTAGDDTTVIVIESRGGVVLPLPLRITLADGRVVDRVVPEDAWMSEGRRVEVTVSGRVVRAEIDPEGAYPDVDRDDDVWVAPPG